MQTRSIEKIVQGVKTSDGAGVNLTRIIASPHLNMLDPFLLLDEFGSDSESRFKLVLHSTTKLEFNFQENL